MGVFRLAVHIIPRRGILDPQGKAVGDALHTLGFADVADVRIGKFVVLDLHAPSAEAARGMARDMCDRLLANPVTEDYEIAAVSGA